MLIRWWTARKRSLGNLLLHLGSVASIAALLANFLPSFEQFPLWGILLALLAFVLTVLFALRELVQRPKRRVFRKDDKTGILNYMHDWIEHGGRVAIWTRDMSWANNDKTKQLLIRKAKCKELLLFLPSPNPLTESLAECGAEVVYYGVEHLDSPESRFTIAQFGRQGSSIAVGRPHGDTHLIDEFHSGDHPAFHIAADLLTLTRSTSDKRPRTAS